MSGLLGKLWERYEAPASVLTGMLAQPVSGLAGLLAMPGGSDIAARAVRKTQDALTYQPRSQTGQNQMQALGRLMQPVENAMNAVGDAGYAVGGPVGGALARVLPEAALLGRPAVPRGVPLPREAGILAYHGSPYKFDKFDMSKIGTGEGAQAYGHGLYFAESPQVAKSYQSALSSDRGFSYGGQSGLTRQQVQDLVNAKLGGGYLDGVTRPSGVVDAVIDDMVLGTQRQGLPRQYKPGSERAKLYEQLKQEVSHANPGSLYKVDIPDEHVGKMLDWDKPLTADAPQPVKDAFNNIVKKYPELKEPFFAAFREGKPGYHYYSLLNDYAKTGDLVKNQSFATQVLREAGIPGIRYLDGGSRGQGAGTSNFVVFDDQIPKIVGRE